MTTKGAPLSVSVFVLAVILSGTIWSVAHAQGAITCDPGMHVVKTGEVPGFAAGTTCTPDSGDFTAQKILYGGCDYNPYEVLEKQYRGNGADKCDPKAPQISPNGQGTAGIDRALACRLTKFFKAVNEKGCSVKIISAYRSPATQQCMCGGGKTGCAAAGSSCHQPGLAVDVQTSCIGWMRMAAPQFQLVFPYYGQHIQCAEHPKASTASCNRACNGGVAINPDLSKLPAPNQVPDTYFSPPAQQSTPTTGIMNAIRSLFGSPAPMQPVPIANQVTQYTQPTPSYSPPSSSTSVNPNEYTPTPAPQQPTGTSSQQHSQNGSATSSNSNTSVNINSNDDDNMIQVINDIAAETSPKDKVVVTTSSPAQLNEDLKNLGSLIEKAEGTLAQSGSATGQGPDVEPAPNPYGSATFAPVQNDVSGYSPAQLSTFSNILTTLKAGLVRLSELLQPFRGRH